jgi:hypothetical protein
VVGTLAAGLATGTQGFWSPVLPRGLRLNTAEDVQQANLDAQHVQITPAPDAGDPEIIVSGHAGTRKALAERFPGAAVVKGNVAPDDVAGKVVAGTLPPHLVDATAAYYAAAVANFDYSKDGDLAGDELHKRLVVNDPVRVTVS